MHFIFLTFFRLILHSNKKRGCFMKKCLIFVFCFVFVVIFFISCNKKNNIENNLSEVTKIYFQGENSNGNLKCSISVGQREDPYKIDGYHNINCDFSLITLKGIEYFSDQIQVNLNVNENLQNVTLFYHPVNDVYINDLGYALKEDDRIEVEYDEEKFIVYNLSKNFKIDYKEALKISKESLKIEIEELCKNNNFCGECYLKVLTNNNDNILFWYFSIQTRDKKSVNLILSVDSGQIVAKN